MATEVNLWEVSGNRLQKLADASFSADHLEDELETWIAQTPDLLGEKLLIVDRQRDLAGVGRLDLLAVDREGKLVIIELKRDRTPREAVAQALHYAAWLDTATEEEVIGFCEQYLKRPLEDAFEESFSEPFPGLVCQNHRIVLAAPKLDSGAELIISYLAERHGVRINAVFFTYSKVGDHEVLARAFLVSEETGHDHGRRRKPTAAHLLELAQEKNIRELVDVCRQLNDVFEEQPSNSFGASFVYIGKTPGGRRRVFGINVSGGKAQAPIGNLDVWVIAENLADVAGCRHDAIRKTLRENHPLFEENAYDCVVRMTTPAEVEALVRQVKVWAGTKTD